MATAKLLSRTRTTRCALSSGWHRGLHKRPGSGARPPQGDKPPAGRCASNDKVGGIGAIDHVNGKDVATALLLDALVDTLRARSFNAHADSEPQRPWRGAPPRGCPWPCRRNGTP